MDVELLLRASRTQLRFPSSKGNLSMEDLWDLPLTTRVGSASSLDAIAKHVHQQIQNETTVSFVETKPNIRLRLLNDQLEILKGVIKIRLEENNKALERAAKAEKRRKLLEALETKENQELSSASKDELLKQLAELDA
jgi:hypothetical protein